MKNVKENIYNVPNFFTLSRIIITLVLVYLIFNGASLKTIVILFVIGAITDAIDGNVA
jgi:phosphatidylglycerophosphate synthase